MFHQPTECARNVRSATKRENHQKLSTPAGSPGGRGKLLFVSLRYHHLSPSPLCMFPATWEVKAEKGRQMGEANGNFSVLFSSLGNKMGNPLMIALLTENVVEIFLNIFYCCFDSQ